MLDWNGSFMLAASMERTTFPLGTIVYLKFGNSWLRKFVSNVGVEYHIHMMNGLTRGCMENECALF